MRSTQMVFRLSIVSDFVLPQHVPCIAALSVRSAMPEVSSRPSWSTSPQGQLPLPPAPGSHEEEAVSKCLALRPHGFCCPSVGSAASRRIRSVWSAWPARRGCAPDLFHWSTERSPHIMFGRGSAARGRVRVLSTIGRLSLPGARVGLDELFRECCEPSTLTPTHRAGRHGVDLSHAGESLSNDVRRLRIGRSTLRGPLAAVWPMRRSRIHCSGCELRASSL